MIVLILESGSRVKDLLSSALEVSAAAAAADGDFCSSAMTN